MKKLLSICFLSILLTLAGFVARAQSPCCVWLENMNPDTLTGIANVPGGQLVLNNAMNPVNTAYYTQTDVYKIHFINSCNIDKLSIDWKVYRDGQLVNGDLSDFANFSIYTFYNRLNQAGPGVPIPWLGGQVLDGHGVPYGGNPHCYDAMIQTGACKEGYPGAMSPDTTFPYSNDYQFAGGYTGIYSQHLDYFNAEFFEQTENIIIINWKQVGDYSLVISIRERTGGTDWTNLYWNQNQDKYIGGHMSAPGRIVATDSIAPFNNYGAFDKEICQGGTFEYGKPAMTFDTEGDYVVAFIDTLCGGHCSVTAIDTLHLFVRENPVVQVSQKRIDNCFGEGLSKDQLAALASYATPDATGLSWKEIQWSTDGTTFDTVVPTPSTVVDTYYYYVRQVNYYANFNEDTVICDGPIDTITYIVHEIPGKPTIGTPNYYYCVGATATSVDENVTAAKDCKLIWSMSQTFDPVITGAALTPSTTTAGVQTFYVYQMDTVNGCFSKDSFDIVTVTVYDNPVVTATAAPTAACLGNEFTLTATPNDLTTYEWVEKGTTTVLGRANVLKVTPTTDGDITYTVNVTKDYLVNSAVVATCNGTADVTITVYPIPAQPTLPTTTSESYCLNDTIPATYVLTATAPTGATCVWYDETGKELDTADSYTVDINAIKPAGNEFKTVKYFVASYNPTTTCISDTMLAFTFDFYKYPVLAVAPKTSTVCPGESVNLTASLTTESKADYTYTWAGDVDVNATINTNTINTSDTDCTGKTYQATVYVTDDNGCKSNTDIAVVNVEDITKPVIKPSDPIAITLYGCDLSIVPAAHTTLAALRTGFTVTVTDGCGKLEPNVTHSDVVTNGFCVSTLVRTYTVSDHCGNTSDLVVTYTVRDNTNPVLTATPAQVDPVPAMNCTYIMPDDTVFYNLLKGHVSDDCTPDTELVASAVFYNGNQLLSNANTDIFADSLTVNVYAQISDRCNNKSKKVHIATLVRPEPMYIKHGSVSIDRNELCLYDTVNLSFSTDSIAGYNHAPYSFLWTGRPNDGTIIHHTWQNALGIPALSDTNFVYTITVTDKYGCIAKDSSDPVHVWNLPTVYIHEDIRNGATFPLCPNYGVLTVEAVAVGRIPNDNTVTYEWSGESVNIQSTNDTTGVYILPDSCNYTYYPHVKVVNVKGCVAEAEFPFDVVDTTAPVVDASAIISDTTLVRQPGCKFFLPDLTQLFNNNNVSDNCYKVGTMTLTQDPVAGTEITENKAVKITLTDHCGNSSVFTINANLPSDNITITNIAVVDTAFCLNGTATLTPSISNGVGTFRYTWTEGSTTVGSDAVLTVTPTTAGVHTYQLSVVDSFDCEATKSANVTVYPLPAAADVTMASTPNEFCKNAYNVNNEANGTVYVTNITTGYMYKLSTDTMWHDANYIYTGLNNGTYSIDLKSDHDCETANATTIVVDSVNNMVLSTATGTPNYRCADPYDGTITVNNPQVNYTYEIINVPNSERVYTSGELKYEGLRNGDYLIQVVSDKFCPYSIYNTIVADSTKLPALPDYATTPKTSCVAPNGAITIHNSRTDYEYTLNNVTLTGNGGDLTFGQLNGGDYTLAIVSTVTACSQQFAGINVPTTTQDPARPLVDSVPNSVCDQAITPNGSITVTNPINGYTYKMGDSTYTYDGTNLIKFVNLIDANNHIMTVTTDLGCAKDFTFEVTSNIVNPNKATFVFTNNTVCTATLPTCVSIATPPAVNGTISLTGTDDTRYTYTVKLGATEILPTSAHAYTKLAAGDYTITVRDNATGCESDTICKILDDAAAITIAADEYTSTPRTSCTAYDGSITINAANGYNYYICNVSNQAITGTQSNLDAGKYNIVKYNIATGCFREDTVVVVDGRARFDTIKYNMVADNVCDNATFTGTGSITVTNLSASDFTFYIDGAINPSNVFSNLHDGTYTISVKNNATQCPGQMDITVADQISKPVITFTTTANTYCTDTIHDGTVTITPEANCIYSLFAADSVYGTTTTITGLKDGSYKLAAYNTTTGCIADTVDVVIKHEPVIPTATVAAQAANYNCKPEKNGSVTISSTIADVTYYLISATPDTTTSTTPTFSGLNSGDYTYYAVTTKGCPSTPAVVTVADSAHIYELELSQTPNTMCVPTFEHPGNGTIVVEKPQARHYTYSFYDNAGAQIDVNYFNPDSYTMYHLKDMLYRVVVFDTITKCSAQDTITVQLHHDDITVTADSTNNDRCLAPYNGTITVNMVNPNIDGVYRYRIDGGEYQISNVFTGLKEGNHTVLVWDTTTNCTYPVAGDLNVMVNKTDYTVTMKPYIKNNEFCVAPFNGAVGLFTDSVTSDIPAPAFLFAFDTNATADPATLTYTNDTTYEQLAAGTYTIYVKETTTDCIYGPFTAAVNTVNENAPIIDSIIPSGYNKVSEYNFCVDANGSLCVDVRAQVPSDTLGYFYQWSSNCFPVNSDSSCVVVNTANPRLHCEYTVQVTSKATGCVTTKTVAIHIDTVPVVHFFVENPNFLNVPSRGIVYNCENKDYTVGVTNPLADYDSIVWTQGHIESNVTSFVEPAYKYHAPTEISYCVNLYDHNGCMAHDYMNVNIKPIATNTVTVDACDSLKYTYTSIAKDTVFRFVEGGTNTYTYVDTFNAVNGCDSIVTYILTVHSSPSLTVDSTAAFIERSVCHGAKLCGEDMLTVKHTTTFGWKFSDVLDFNSSDEDFDPTANMTFANNGRTIYAYAYNACDTVISTQLYTLHIDSLPVVPNISTNSRPYCDSTVFDLTAPVATCNAATCTGRWQLNGVDTIISKFVYGMNNGVLRYAVTNACGTSYSNEQTLTVYNTAKLDLTYTFDSLCVGTTGDITFTVNTGNSDTLVFDSKYFKVSKSGNTYTITPDSANVGVSSVDIYSFQEPTVPAGLTSPCQFVKKTVEFYIVDKPVVDVVANPDSICAGNVLTGLVVPTHNDKNGAVLSEGWLIAPSVNGTYTEFDPTSKLYMVNNGNYIKYQVTNRCGTTYSNAVPVVVDTIPFGQLTPSPIIYCVGDSIHYTDMTLTLTVSPTAPLTVQPYLLKNGSVYTRETALTMADSNATLMFKFANKCGYNTSNTIKVLVNDTASLVVDRTGLLDTICVGATPMSFKVTTYKSNVMTYDVSNTTDFELTTATNVTADAKETTFTITPKVATEGVVNEIYVKVESAVAICDREKFDTIRFTIADTAHFSTAPKADTVCEGSQLTLVTPIFTTPNASVVSEKWQSNVSGAWADFTETTPMTKDYNGKYLRYAVETRCGVNYSDSIQLMVYDTVKLTTISPNKDTLCSGTAMDDQVYSFEGTYVQIGYTFNPASITGVSRDSVATTTDEIHTAGTYTIKGTDVQASHGIYEATVTATSTVCPATNKSLTFELYIDTLPTITFNNGEQLYCIGETPTFKRGEAVSLNAYNTTDSVVTGYIKTQQTDGTYTAWNNTLPTTITADLDSAWVSFTITNHCGESVINDSLLVVVEGKPLVTAPTVTDTCVGSPLSDFIKTAPVVTLPTRSSRITAQGWLMENASGEYVPVADNTPITQDTNIRYYAATRCDKDTCAVVRLVVTKLPEITSTITTNDFHICSGDTFKSKTMTYINVAKDTTTLWTITKVGSTTSETLVFGQAYDTSYNGATVRYIVMNECGSDTVYTSAQVDTLPVPVILGDTTVCATGSTTLSVTYDGYASYQWFMDGDTITTDATSYTYDYTSAGEGSHVFTVSVKDGNGCMSAYNINGTADKDSKIYKPESVTVEATDAPRFIFKDVNGTTTHRLPSMTTSTSLADKINYTWQVNAPCAGGDELVFVTFDFYHNGRLIPNDSIGVYFLEEKSGMGANFQKWMSSDSIEWYTYDMHLVNSVARYDYAQANNSNSLDMGNHYPVKKLAGGFDNYDDVFLHFLNNRPVYKKISPALIAGEYRIVYRLYSVSNYHTNNDLYHNLDTNRNLLIGGSNSLGGPISVIIEDTLKFTVTGEDLHYTPTPAVEPEPEPIIAPATADEPTVKVYPNPTSGDVYANIEGFEGAAVVRIVTLAGKVVAEETVTTTKNASVIYSRTTSDLTPGVYFLTVQSGDAKISKKLVVTR